MQKTIWIHSVLAMMMNTEDTALAVSFRWFFRVVGAVECVIYLREKNPDTAMTPIYADGETVCVTDFQNAASFYPYAESVLVTEKPYTGTRFQALPMQTKQVAVFGVCVVKTKEPVTEGRYAEAFAAFCSTVYSEGMTGFLASGREPALDIRDVVMNYKTHTGSRNVVNGVSFAVHRGELTVIMGRSGCGKSTLLNLLGGMLTPCKGEILLSVQDKDGKTATSDIALYKEKEKTLYRRNVLGFIFQNYNLIGDLTASENIAVAASLVRQPENAEDMLSLVGLAEKANAHPSRMSGGEQQRVCIARALVKRPSLLLCDEPTGALDTENAKNVMCILQSIAWDRQIPVVVVTHNPEFAVLADHIIEMRNGEILRDEYQPFPYPAERAL